MREGLMNDFFFSSIVKKSEYYYNRRLVRNKLAAIVPPDVSKAFLNGVKEIRRRRRRKTRRIWLCQLFRPNDSQRVNEINKEYEKEIEKLAHNTSYSYAYDTIESIKNLYAEKLDESEAEWIDVIISPLADKHFSFYPEWFEELTKKEKTF